jgi:hypothetical protein
MDNKYSFENFIMQCCKAREWDLRKFLKKLLQRNGFRIIEDNYTSHRDSRFSTVHNMLAIRGEPRICLVAHTDVCRDHISYHIPEVDPVIKVSTRGGEMRAIIQDRDCRTQVGGDDRLGVAINTWIATNTGYDVGLLFTTDEEMGLVSAEYVHFPELLDFDLLVQVDRGNNSDQLVTNISGVELCSSKTGNLLLKIAEQIGLPRYRVQGFLTDVLALKTNGACREAVNMTCGYHNSIGADRDEYIDIQEAKDTMKYVANIIKYYDLEDMIGDSLFTGEEIVDEVLEDIVEQQNSIHVLRPGRKHRRKQRYIHAARGYEEDLFSEERYIRDKYHDEEPEWSKINFMR